MKNFFFPEENIAEDDLYFMCYIIERIARNLHQRNAYVIDAIGYEELVKKISVANVLHCENPEKIEEDWIQEFDLKTGEFDIQDVDLNLVQQIPSATQMGKVYWRLILNTLNDDEDYIQGMIRVYHSKIAPIIDNYNASAYYEPSYVQVRAYYAGSFDGE